MTDQEADMRETETGTHERGPFDSPVRLRLQLEVTGFVPPLVVTADSPKALQAALQAGIAERIGADGVTIMTSVWRLRMGVIGKAGPWFVIPWLYLLLLLTMFGTLLLAHALGV